MTTSAAVRAPCVAQLRAWAADPLQTTCWGLAELADEIERLRSCFSEASNFALAARTADTLDAERYRYLRNAAGQYMGDEDGPTVCSGLSDLFEFHFGPEVDEVVDAAIARWKAAGCPLPKEAPK